MDYTTQSRKEQYFVLCRQQKVYGKEVLHSIRKNTLFHLGGKYYYVSALGINCAFLIQFLS
jgi:hypothetical protein